MGFTGDLSGDSRQRGGKSFGIILTFCLENSIVKCMTANDVQYDKLRRDQCNELIPRVFRVNLPIDEILFDDIETGDGSYAILFRSSGDVYALFVAPDGGQQTLADVVTMSKNMGITIGKFYLPDGDLNYFYRNGVKLFKQAFPSLYSWNKKDVKWYSLQVPYSPALVKVASVNGEVRRFDKAGRAWQKLFDYSFRKVRVHYERG